MGMAKSNYKVLLKMAVISSLMTHHGGNKSGFTALVREEWEESSSEKNWENRKGSHGTIKNAAGRNARSITTPGGMGGNHRSKVVGETTQRNESAPKYGSKLEL